jgi:HK97 family phage major capsid protein
MSLKQITALSAMALAGLNSPALASGATTNLFDLRKKAAEAEGGYVEQEMQQNMDGPKVLTGSVAKAMDAETDPEKKLLAGVTAAGKQMDALTTQVDQWHTDTKKAAEDFTKAKNDFDGLSSSVKAFEQTIAKFRMQMACEKRMAFGDPIQRIVADEEKRTLVNALVRSVLAPLGVKMSEAHQKALSEGSTPGSTYLKSDLAKDIYDVLSSYGIWNTLSVERLGTLTTNFPVATADPIAQFIDEAGAISDDTNIAGSTVAATVKKIAVALYLSRELLQDSEYDVTSRVMKMFGRATAKRMDYAAFRADGTADATNGGFTGLFQFGTLVTAASGNTTMETLDFEDITSVLLTPGEEILNTAARWWLHQHILIRLLHIKDSNGRPIFLTALEAPAPNSVGTILGYPVTTGNICPTTNSAGSRVLSFGDPDGFAVGIRQDLEIASSEHVRFLNDQVTFRGVARASFKGKAATSFGVLRTAAS